MDYVALQDLTPSDVTPSDDPFLKY